MKGYNFRRSFQEQTKEVVLRLVNLIIAVLVLVLIVIAVDPNARQKAVALVNRWNDRIVVNEPSVTDEDDVRTPSPTLTPVPTAVAGNDGDEIIPNTGGEDKNQQPIIQVNWDALGQALRNFWDSLRNIKINLNPQNNK